VERAADALVGLRAGDDEAADAALGQDLLQVGRLERVAVALMPPDAREVKRADAGRRRIRSGLVEWDLLADVPRDEVRELLSIARRRRFDRGVVVCHRGDPGDALHLVVSGRFTVQTTTPVGETVTVRLLGRGDIFGELALVDASPRSATITAIEPSETFSVYVDDFQRLRSRYPAVNDVLVGLLAREVRSLSERLLEALYVPSEKRIRRRLVELTEVYGGDGENVELPLTQAELGEFAGAARATVNRVLREEERLGAVELRRGRTVVLDPEAIARRGR
jgi:CRP-like cAMP-binding protein